jgi:hypothetical protein
MATNAQTQVNKDKLIIFDTSLRDGEQVSCTKIERQNSVPPPSP